ncbi:TPA: hypothetical protein ACR3Z0_005811 [Bacillus thuringiensis]|nr:MULTISPECIES: hypothetical protein [Bacillus]CUB51427.1 hypothetical protein BN2127_JRS10_00946 [Bacillus subtilis]ETE93085.1 hypothetical protein C621_0211105 [Bacillus thuringiensis serovar aizawai str. Leapi01]ETE97672.1 hypothetical protein C623_0213075 [Bacillus thuringiensis serovar aizawai str. Hu4-2]ETE97709.1 hypothetical protein C623_0212790 [Bacillus thuringiensis serovar aizawai str. Hu4-2]KLA37340.1 hypothetical protein B4158_4934 [Bacillus cereus]
MKKNLIALLMCVGVLGFGLFGEVNQIEKTNPVQYMMTDPGGS